jgi:hypothetical protein
MGRCYEFGTSIADDCDHAMVVSSEGGSCVCVRCGTACTGRFAGCSEIIAQPGRVPVFAPVWALDAEATPPAPVGVGGRRGRRGRTVSGEDATRDDQPANGLTAHATTSNGHAPIETGASPAGLDALTRDIAFIKRHLEDLEAVVERLAKLSLAEQSAPPQAASRRRPQRARGDPPLAETGVVDLDRQM